MLELNGGNDYKIRRMGKQALLRQLGYLPRTLAVTDEALQVVQIFSGMVAKLAILGTMIWMLAPATAPLTI